MAPRSASSAKSDNCSEQWPGLPALNDTQTIYVDGRQWLQHPCPPELEKLPISLPAGLVSIVKASTRREQYLQAQNTGSLVDVNPPKTEPCVCCYDETPQRELVHLQCQHKYCGPCISQMAQTATESEYLFPPRCCSQEIAMESVLPCLSSEEKQRYTRKAREYSTPHANRWYCPSPSCSEWILPERLDLRLGSQSCPYCGTSICSGCRSKSHPGDCVSDDALLEVARCRRWQRCYQCRTLVELTIGCNHVQCRCGAEFCYGCGKQWNRERHYLCLPAEQGILGQGQDEERGLDAAFVAATMHYADNGSVQEPAEEPLYLPEGGVWSPSSQRVSIEAHMRVMRDSLTELNRLQQLSLIKRQREQILMLFPSQRSHGKRSLFGKVQGKLESRIRRPHVSCGQDNVLQLERPERSTKSFLRSLVQGLAYDRIWFDEAIAERERLLEVYRHELISSEQDV